jgi:hypothetical protein
MNCLKCHGIRDRSLDAHCLECHNEIEWLRAQGRGLHGLDAVTECAACHKEHGGREFAIVYWRGEGFRSFDHRRAGWDLVGKHANTECRACHREEHRKSVVTLAREGGLGDDTWLGLETSCATCHTDPHQGRLGTDCVQCHTADDFRTIVEGEFDHARTRYPLEGAHREVACARCHRTVEKWIDQPPFESCASCHSDPHAGLATISGREVDCAICHGVRGFRPSLYTVAMHAESPFPLEGKHRRVACEECHPKLIGERELRRAGSAGVQLRRPHARCADCHADAHGGQLARRRDGGACASCHGLDGFLPTTFGVTDHRKLEFALQGRHADVSCHACHGPDRPGLPALPGRDVLGPAGVQFRMEKADCETCHHDPHLGRFAANGDRPAGEGCLSCHDTGSFRRSRVDAELHRGFAFALDGAHAAVPCLECHRELDRPLSPSTLVAGAVGPALAFRIERRDCRDCHEDPHGGQFSHREDEGACTACHGVDAFRPAVRFDHRRDSVFPLEGAHARTACVACHQPAEFADGNRGPWYRPLPHRCEDCHASPPPPLEGGTR